MDRYASGHRLTIYVRTGASGNREIAFKFAQEGALRVVYWADGPFGCALPGDIERAAVLWPTVDSSLEQLDLRWWWYEHIGEPQRATWIAEAAH